MPGIVPDRIFAYRMLHWDCVPDALDRGFYPKRHRGFLPPPKRIGDVDLADKRDAWLLRTPKAGTIGEHVAFYFAGHSPMLNKIRTGYGVPYVDQRDIVYICCKLESLVAQGHPYLFTDGQANTKGTNEYTELTDLNKLDWTMIHEKFWKDTVEDRDRMRRKQAEFLVKGHVPVACFLGLYTFDAQRRADVQQLLNERGLNIPVRLDTNRNLYF
jgi:ssDNA thymidine ADP-ribosyltransferase, DarT